MPILRSATIAATLLCAISISTSAMSVAADPTDRPNILFIMVDDMGYADLGSYGNRHQNTPNIDQLASQGLKLTNGYANAAICSPTRTALLTGQYQYRFPLGLEEPVGKNFPEDGNLSVEQPTWGSLFRDQGYFTALVGKWHLGDPPDHSPLQHGYNYFYGIPKGAADYFQHKADLASSETDYADGLFRNDEKVEEDGYLTDLFANEVIKLIENRDDRPFMISLHFNAPHWPWEGPEDEAVSATLGSIFHYDGGSLKTYAEMMSSMDTNVGRILKTLQNEGIADNTIVIFTSDNGAERFSDTWPFTGMKGELLEGGIHVPIIVRWPNRIAARSESEQMMISMDFIPTLLAAVGADVDESQFDGKNLLPVLLGEQAFEERTLFWRFKAHDQQAVRQGDWKYLKIGDHEHLYNLAQDQRERAELANKYPGKLAELKALWQEWNQHMLPYPENSSSQNNIGSYGDRY